MADPQSNTPDLLAEIERLRGALRAIVDTPRSAGIYAAHRIASTALNGGKAFVEPSTESLGDPVYTRRVVEYLHAKYQSRCAYCGSSDAVFQIDHVVPVSRGGGDDVGNLVLACVPCNKAKGARTAAEFGHPEVAQRTIGSVLPKGRKQ